MPDEAPSDSPKSDSPAREFDLSTVLPEVRKERLGEFRQSILFGLVLVSGGPLLDFVYGGFSFHWDPISSGEFALTLLGSFAFATFVVSKGLRNLRTVPTRLAIGPTGIYIVCVDGSIRALPLAIIGSRFDLMDAGPLAPGWPAFRTDWDRYRFRVGTRTVWDYLTAAAFGALQRELPARGLIEVPRPRGWNDPIRGALRSFVVTRPTSRGGSELTTPG